MAMDAKDLRIESALGARGDDGNTKFAQSGTALQANGNQPYHDIGSNSLAKVDVPPARPCAIIGPDRVVPPQSLHSAFLKKVPVEPWPCTDNIYQHPPEYPHKPTEYQPSRNISPRQTFQENMQRIMVPPSYASVKHSEDNCLKNPKFSDVPYTISTINNEPKSVKCSEGLLPNNSPNQPAIPNGWGSGGVNVRPLRPYGAPEFYQYSEYPNYPGPRPISMIRPHRNIHEDGPPGYQDRLYNEANIRFKPYPTAKERPLHHPQARYEYIPNYPSVFHPHAAYPPHKYDIQKTIPTHAYSMYPPVPLKYLDRRMTAPQVEKFSRSPTQQVNFNSPFCNQNIPSTYGSIPGNCMQNRGYPYAPDASTKHMMQNKIYYEANNAHKYYTSPENIFMNDNINRPPNLKNDVLYPSYPPPINIHSVPPHHMYRKESSMKGFDQAIHYRNMEYSANINPLSRVPLQFLPQTMSMSSDSNTSNDTPHIVGNTQDDFGYVSQSPSASIKSIDSGVSRISSNVYRRNDVRHEPTSLLKPGLKVNSNVSSKDKKDLDVRQFLQMWNEGEDEGNENKARQKDTNNSLGPYESGSTQEQLYVLDLVNVPNEELAKYDHIQKISKLPENIKGYNSIELLNQYEKLVETPSLNHFAVSPSQPKQKDLHVPLRNGALRHGVDVLSAKARPLSPLDVEAKISQSVIHKEVGCNFEIRPCSPQMMNVEIATPVINVLGERLIEKVVNSVNKNSPLHHRIEESNNHSPSRNSPKVTSCKMANNHYPSPNVNDSLKTNYCLQDLEGNSGVCLASLPRLDNEIELNFPEINQQFINANKISSIQDLPILDTEICTTANKIISKIHNQPFIPENLHSGSESDKEVTKLSKYRKHKRNSTPSENSDMSHISQPRTDSVIIKNPENVKCQEDINNIHVVGKNTSSKENIVKPLSTENERTLKISDKNFAETIYEHISDYNSIGVSDTAIDFSINKSDDEQNNRINKLNNISDALQNNIEIVKNINTPSETIDSSIGTSVKNISKKLGNTSVANDFSILQPKSPELDNFTCSSVLQNIDSQSSDETYETGITSSIPKYSDVKLSNDTSAEKIIPLNHLPYVPHDTENLSKNISTCNPAENNSASIADINKEIQNFVLVENLDNVISAVCEPNYNLMQKNQTAHTDVTVTNDEDCSKSDQKEHCSLREDVAGVCNTHLDTDTKKLGDDENLRIQENEYEKIQTVSMESEINSQTTAENLKTKKEILKSKTESDDVVNVVECKTDENIDLTDKLATENQLKNEESNIIKLGCITPDKNDDLMTVSMNDLDPVQIESNKVDIFENNKMISEISRRKITLDINDELQTLPSLYKDQTVEKGQFITKSHIFKVIFRKELFSSRFQNLWMENEGFCSSLESFKSQNMQRVSQNIIGKYSCTEIGANSSSAMETTIEDNTVSLEPKNTSGSIIITAENKENTVEVEIRNPDLTDFKAITRAPILTDLEGENNSATISNVLKDIIHNQTIVESNQTSDALVEVAENNTNRGDVENIVDSNINFNHNIKENVFVTEQLICNQLLNRRNRTLKRSLSESAVNLYNLGEDTRGNYDENFMHCKKRPKIADTEIFVESQMITDNFASFIQSNRRNSISTTLYNEENVSLCIVIDNDCILTEENESCEKICYTDLSDDEGMTAICTEGETMDPEFNEEISYEDTTPISIEGRSINFDITEYFPYENDVSIANAGILNSELLTENIPDDNQKQYVHVDNELTLEDMEVKTVEESWVEDVACIETVFSDDVAEDVVISAPSSPKDTESSEEESDITSFMFNVNKNEHTDRVKCIYGNQMCDNDALLVEKLYRTPQMDVNKTLIDRESQFLQGYSRYYDNESLEKILSECNTLDTCTSAQNESILDNSVLLPHSITCEDLHGNKENLKDHLSEQESRDSRDGKYSIPDLPTSIQTKAYEEKQTKTYDDCNMQSCKSSGDNFESYKKEEKLQYAISSSPEVSSTTPEEKGPGILLTIRSYKGTKISEVNEMSESFKHAHSQRFNNNGLSMSRPLITKAAQKYIPPLKETIRDLKVKIRLPKQSLYKLQQLKNSKEEPKIDTSRSKNYIKSLPQESPKKAKPKPKFEDVLMSIDEIQFKKHKEKHKKTKQSVPKVIIKKNENGAHYASTESKETYNPDLTGRKWQPWVFLEKSNFVDKMALKQKFKAIYSHRKKTFVLAENFQKYKSISNPKFVISHPKCNDNNSTGKLKYTIRLKHT